MNDAPRLGPSGNCASWFKGSSCFKGSHRLSTKTLGSRRAHKPTTTHTCPATSISTTHSLREDPPPTRALSPWRVARTRHLSGQMAPDGSDAGQTISRCLNLNTLEEITCLVPATLCQFPFHLIVETNSRTVQVCGLHRVPVVFVDRNPCVIRATWNKGRSTHVNIKTSRCGQHSTRT